MKSGGVHMGNVKMRGKRFKTLSCGCCDAKDFRWDELWKQAESECSYSKVNWPDSKIEKGEAPDEALPL